MSQGNLVNVSEQSSKCLEQLMRLAAELFDHLRDLAISCGALDPRANSLSTSEPQAERAPMQYYFNGRHVCRESWRELHGIGTPRFRRIQRAVLTGKFSVPVDMRFLKRGLNKAVSPKWGEVHGYILELYECLAEALPDDAGPGSDDNSADENLETPIIQIRRPDGIQTANVPTAMEKAIKHREERYLPQGSMFDYWKQMRAVRPEIICSFRLFWQIWCSDFFFLKIRKGFTHRLCTICLKHKSLIKQLAHDVRSRDKQRALWQRHLDAQYRDRCYYWDLRQQSRLFKRPIIMILDGADQAKFAWPRHDCFSAHQFDSLIRPRCHIVGCILHGYIDVLSLSHTDVHTGGSSTVEIIAYVLGLLVNRNVSLKGRDLYLQLDNAASSNKNLTVLSFCAVIACLAGLRSASALFLRSGHSHEDIDQQHGQMSSWTKNRLRVAQTLEDFKTSLQVFLDRLDRPHEPLRIVTILDEMRNWKQYFEHLNITIKGHGGPKAPHVFDFRVENDMVVLRQGTLERGHIRI